MNGFVTAISGLVVAVLIMLSVTLLGRGLREIARLALGKSRDEWKEIEIQRFWLVNAIQAPFMLAFYALIIRILGFSATQVGFNFNNLGTSLLVALPIAVVLGSLSATVAPRAAQQGLSPMRVDFGRSLTDVIGSIAYMVILVGPLEEIPFRGILQTYLNTKMPQTVHLGPLVISLGTFFAAIFFVAYHYRNVMIGGETREQFWRQVPSRTVLSFILALLFQSTGSLVGPILFHNIVDTFTIASLSISIYRWRQAGKWPPKKDEEAVVEAL